MTDKCLFDLEACLQHDLWFLSSVEMGNPSSENACSSCWDWGFHASRALGARYAFEIFQLLHVDVGIDARRQTFSSEASVHASSLPRLIEPNPLLIFP